MFKKNKLKLIENLVKASVVVGMFSVAVGAAYADTYVHSYTKSDGTYVSGYYRSSPDATVKDNWSVKGNVNPVTGKAGTESVQDEQREEGRASY